MSVFSLQIPHKHLPISCFSNRRLTVDKFYSASSLSSVLGPLFILVLCASSSTNHPKLPNFFFFSITADNTQLNVTVNYLFTSHLKTWCFLIITLHLVFDAKPTFWKLHYESSPACLRFCFVILVRTYSCFIFSVIDKCSSLFAYLSGKACSHLQLIQSAAASLLLLCPQQI